MGLRSDQRFLNSRAYFVRGYHSYPDPNEVAKVQTTISNNTSTFSKCSTLVGLDESFKLEREFPGVPKSKGISKNNIPQTMISKLSNGLTVASQEMPGFMVSFAFLVKAGR